MALPPPNPARIAAAAAAAAHVDGPHIVKEVRYLMYSNPDLDPDVAAQEVTNARRVLAILAMPVFWMLIGAYGAFFGGLGEYVIALARFLTTGNPLVFIYPGLLVLLGVFLYWVTIGGVRALWWRAARRCGAPYEMRTSPWVFRRRPREFRSRSFLTPEQEANLIAVRGFMYLFLAPVALFAAFGVFVTFLDALEKAQMIMRGVAS